MNVYHQQWINYLAAERRYSPLTVRAYDEDLQAFEKYIDNDTPQQATFADLRGYIMLSVERGDNPKSINRHLSALKSFFTYLVRSGVITKNPTLKLTTLPQQTRLPEFITDKNCEKLIKSLMEWTDDPIERRNAMIVLLLYSTGIRRAELVSLTIENIDLGQQKIRLIGKGQKEREIPLLEQVCKILEQYLLNNIWKTEKKHLFLTKNSEPITVNDVYLIVVKVLKLAGIQGRQSPHTLRHTFATALMKHGAPIKSVQELLGHSSLSSTQVYTHNTIDFLKESYLKAHPRARK